MHTDMAFKNRFNDYLSNKLSKDKKEQLFRGQFSQPSHSSSQNNSNNTIALSSNSSKNNKLPFFDTPSSRNSSFSINSSQFDFSKYKSSKEKLAQNNNSTQRKRLKKLRQLEENECAICLDQITNRCQLACKHRFCHDCLLGWLINTNRCPYCRAEVNSYWFKGEEFEVESKEFEYEGDEAENLDWVCYNCDHTNDGDIVLICDRCEANACHIQCDPSLRGVEPRGDWYCHFCR